MAVTPNLGLHQWQSGDSFLRTDFNEDFLKLDGAVRCKAGSYTGDGTAGRVIELGGKPKLVILMGSYRPSGQTYSCLLVLLEGMLAVQYGNSGVYTHQPPAGYTELTESGFRLEAAGLNAAGYENHYIAFY